MDRSYTTKQGDTWDLIAYKIYKDEYKAGDIIDNNIDFADYVIFPPGIKLNIPIIETVDSSSLPPWKR